MKTSTLNMVIEPDEDRWHAYCPALVHPRRSNMGHTEQEALKNIRDVVRMVVESLTVHGQPAPKGPAIRFR
jgi:predicted RNase H-like HicB family nuclease